MTAEETRLMREIVRDHPRPNYYTGKRASGYCPTAMEARQLPGNKPEERKTFSGMQLKMDLEGV